jgi:hypothetical protein
MQYCYNFEGELIVYLDYIILKKLIFTIVGGEYLIYMILKNKTEYEFRSWIQIYR